MTTDTMISANAPDDVADTVARALREDVGDGDRNADLVPESARGRATVVAREAGILAGRPWFDEVFRQLGGDTEIDWRLHDGETLVPDRTVCELAGSMRTLLTGERTALNFLQLLSGTATRTRRFVECVEGTQAVILDTRKTLPGLRRAQKYAVRVGGGVNHRFGLFDAILIKENHIAAAGSIAAAVEAARRLHPKLGIQVEVENLDELEQALAADTDAVLLDNFSETLLAHAVERCRRHRRPNGDSVPVEASGDIGPDNVRAVAETGVDRISIGGLTKHVTAIDLSMRIQRVT